MEFCAAFPDDLSRALAECPSDGILGDYLPFHERLAGVDDAQIRQLVDAAAALTGQPVPGWLGEPLGEGPAAAARVLDRDAVRLLAAFDDIAVGKLRREWWQRLGREGEPDVDLAIALRGLVVQCRAAVANGWVVVAISRS